jgi:hypothetical protein
VNKVWHNTPFCNSHTNEFHKGMAVLASNSLPSSGGFPHPPMIDRAVGKVAFSGTQLHAAGHVFFRHQNPRAKSEQIDSSCQELGCCSTISISTLSLVVGRSKALFWMAKRETGHHSGEIVFNIYRDVGESNFLNRICKEEGTGVSPT